MTEPNPFEAKKDNFDEIRTKFLGLSVNNITREEIKRQFEGYEVEDILEATSDSENAHTNPSALFLILDMYDVNLEAKIRTAETLVDPKLDASAFDPVVRGEAQAFLYSRAEK